jgi:hypothetical protein
MALLVEHDLVDYINAGSTVVIAGFTVLMFFVVRYQLQASKDIERAWLMPKLEKDPFSSMLLCEGTTQEHGKITSVTTAAFLQLTLTNEGEGPVWVKELLARLILVDSVEDLPKMPELNRKDDQKWYPAPFVKSDSVRLQLTTDGSQVQKEFLVAFGKVTYLDKFREERYSTFGYVIPSGEFKVERLKSYPEYNRNT